MTREGAGAAGAPAGMTALTSEQRDEYGRGYEAGFARGRAAGQETIAEPGEAGLRARLYAMFDDEQFMLTHLNARSLTDAVLAALRAPVADAGLDVERLGEAIFRVGTGYRQRETAGIPSRITNSQDGARASGEFAEAIAAEYARLTPTEPPDFDREVTDILSRHASPGNTEEA